MLNRLGQHRHLEHLSGFKTTGDGPWMKLMYPKTVSEEYCHNKPRWNMALVTVGFLAVKHGCNAEGARAHDKAGTWPLNDRVRNALSRPYGSVCFSYHHTHWKWFKKENPIRDINSTSEDNIKQSYDACAWCKSRLALIFNYLALADFFGISLKERRCARKLKRNLSISWKANQMRNLMSLRCFSFAQSTGVVFWVRK